MSWAHFVSSYAHHRPMIRQKASLLNVSKLEIGARPAGMGSRAWLLSGAAGRQRRGRRSKTATSATPHSGRPIVPVGPGRERIIGQRAVIVTCLARHFGADPVRSHEGLIDGIQFDLGQDEPGVVSEKCVALPHMPLKRNKCPALFDDGTAAKRQHGFGFENRYSVLELETLQI